MLRYGLTLQDYRVLSETLPTVLDFVPMARADAELRRQDRVCNARGRRLFGRIPDVNVLELQQGRFITDRDISQLANVVVLVPTPPWTSSRSPIRWGKACSWGRGAYTVIGVTPTRTASAGIGGSLSAQTTTATSTCRSTRSSRGSTPASSTRASRPATSA